MSDISSYSVRNPKQIAIYLSLLAKNGSMISARLSEGGKSYLTSVLDVNTDKNVLVLDCGVKEELNQLVEKAHKVTFNADYHGIKVSFIGNDIKRVIYQDESAFIMPMPKTIFWMERREYFRAKSPLSKVSYCQLSLDDRLVNLRLCDISLTGFSVFNSSRELSGLILPDMSFTKAKLVLSDCVDENIISFIIRYKFVTNNKNQKTQKIGCKFTDINRQVEDAVQQYIQNIQREDLQVDAEKTEKNPPYRKKILIYINSQ